MKKITAAFDGLKYSLSTRDYAIDLAAQTKAHLVGAFMDDQLYNSYTVYNIIVKDGVPPDSLEKFEAKDKATRDSAAEDFERVCISKSVDFSIHRDRDFAIQEVIHESIYSDLLVINAAETMSHQLEKPPTRFIRDLLSDVQCPVILIPAEYKPINKIVLLYDGEPTSVYAIKMFSYLLPQMQKLETEVISIKGDNNSLHVHDIGLMSGFMRQHFEQSNYTEMDGLSEHETIGRLQDLDENTLVVLGSHRRSSVSRLFSKSMADVLMKEIKSPLFIAYS